MTRANLVRGFSAVLLGAWLAPMLLAADHRDSPLVLTDGRLDLNDVYVFRSPANTNNTVLIMTVNPFAGALSPTTFSSRGVYEFKIDSDGDAKEDLTYRITFSAPDTEGVQDVTVLAVPAKNQERGAILARGKTGQDVAIKGGGTLRADLFDDPFFFDIVGFRDGFNFTGTDFFAGFNTSAIVLEVPSSRLGPNNIGVWAVTRGKGGRFDREGRPAINTVLIPAGLKDKFNRAMPRQDERLFRDAAINTLLSLGNDQATAESLADFLLPDIMTIDTSSGSGFPNGRRLADDVIDIELNLLSGGAVTTDRVDANDKPFLDVFPYLAAPH